jgi:Cof subfamily protein (haloacid dehalogenase superfamily)
MNDLAKVKMIISDFDQTITNFNDEIADETIKSIKRFINLGGIFGIATGRSFPLMKYRIPSFDLKDYIFPLITYQGAVTSTSDGKIKHLKCIPRKTVLKVVKYLEENHLLFHVSSHDRIIAIDSIKKVTFFDRVEVFAEIAQFEKSVYMYLVNHSDIDIVEVSLLCESNETEQIKNTLNTMYPDEVFFVKSHPKIIETTEISTSKGNAIKTLIKDYKLNFSEVLVFGDSHNDLSMFEIPVIKIAVDNADPLLKEKADYVSDSCNDLGVANVINKVCDLKEKLPNS